MYKNACADSDVFFLIHRILKFVAVAGRIVNSWLSLVELTTICRQVDVAPALVAYTTCSKVHVYIMVLCIMHHLLISRVAQRHQNTNPPPNLTYRYSSTALTCSFPPFPIAVENRERE